LQTCEKLRLEAWDLIEQMEIAVHGVSVESERQKCANRLLNFKADFRLLESELVHINVYFCFLLYITVDLQKKISEVCNDNGERIDEFSTDQVQ